MPNAPGPNILAGLYYDFSIPLGLYNIVQTVIANTQNDPNTPNLLVQRAARQWFSQPRPCTDTTTEVIQINFRNRLTIRQIGFQALRVPCTISMWYQDRNSNWVPMTDTWGNPISIHISYSASTPWYTFETDIHAVLAKSIQLRAQRTIDPIMGNNPFVIGITELLIGRKVYTLQDAVTAIEDQQDVLGNVITSYVRNWDANRAIDNDPTTFWKSFPQPDPNAVVALYLDTRDTSGNPQLIDTIYIDPVYTGNQLNLYYSNDPTIGTLFISPISLPPDTQTNAVWTQDLGMADTSGPDLSNSELVWPISFGPLGIGSLGNEVWFGVEWTPDFDPGDGPPDDPILLSNTPLDTDLAADDGLYWHSIYYHVGAGEIRLEFTNGTNIVSYHCPLSPAFGQYDTLQIVAGWAYTPNTVFIEVTRRNIEVIGSVTFNDRDDLPLRYTLDGHMGHTNFRGLMTALVCKMEPWVNGYKTFENAPTFYCNPGPVQPDSQGNFPSTTLDNAVLACDWTTQKYPIGGSDESWFENKTWTPVFSNYTTRKGNLFLPQAVAMSFLKMEFTNLTAEPYPVYEQGIRVEYSVFPVSVVNIATYGYPGGLQGWWDKFFRLPLTLQSDVTTVSIGSVNWFNPSTIQNAVNSNFGVTQPPIQVVSGPGTITNSIPNVAQASITTSYRSEQSNPWIYPRKIMNSAYLAGQSITTISNSPTSAQTMQSATNPVSTQVAATFTPVTTVSNSNVLPVQGKDWWLFPGSNLKMPATVMNALTGTQVVTKRGPSETVTVRFTTVCVHKYDINTVTLDSAVGYFAGVNEVQPYRTTYISGNDPLSFSYSPYDPTTFLYSANVFQETTGPLSTAGTPYVLENPFFEYPLELTPWTATGPWYWDSQHGPGSENGQGDEPAAAIVADGLGNYTLVSEPLPVNPGDQILISALVAYYGAASSAGGTLTLSAVAYEGGLSAGNVTLAMPTTTATWVVATRAAMLLLGATLYDSATITTTADQGTYILIGGSPSVFSNWTFTGYGTLVNAPSGNIDGRLFIQLTGVYDVPGSGVDHLAISLDVNSLVTAGTIYWGGVTIAPVTGIEATVALDAVTTSTFADVAVNVMDSGLVTSDALWARVDPLATSIPNLQLAPYANTIPSVIPSGEWADSQAKWDDTTIDWGEPFSEVQIQVDPNLIFQGNRAIHFTRAAGAGEAGILLTQQTNMAANQAAQLGAVFFKPTANANQITVRLRRVSDGVYIHSETFTPITGYWYTWLGQFFDLPNIFDQVYTIEFVLTGDAVDEVYLANLFTNLAGIRYALQLGGGAAPLVDITALVHGGNCHVSCNVPVNELLFVLSVYNGSSWAYGVDLQPRYLK